MKTVLFISNVNKASKDAYLSKEDYSVSTLVDMPSKIAASLGFNSLVGINRYYATTFNIEGIEYYNQLIFRNPFNFLEVKKGYKNVESIIKNRKIDLIFCCTPLGGYVGRKLGKKYHIPVIYQAHGFHFYKGAPLLNWLLYYPIEKKLAKYTDVLITINNEDYEIAQRKFKVKKKLMYIPGIGIDIDSIVSTKSDDEKLKKELGISNDIFSILSVGYINKNKNHQLVIRAMAMLKDSRIHYYIAGEGSEKEKLCHLAQKLGVADNVHFLGYRKDVLALYKAVDLFVLPSLREGLPVSVMEAVCQKTMVIASNIRGVNEIVDDCMLFKTNDVKKMSYLIKECVNGEHKETILSNFNRLNKYDIKIVSAQLKALFTEMEI